MSKGYVYILSAPSGTGKTTVGNLLLKELPFLERVITATTRKPRAGEVDGKDYYFLSEEDFLNKIESGFIASVFEEYGMQVNTSKTEWVAMQSLQGPEGDAGIGTP